MRSQRTWVVVTALVFVVWVGRVEAQPAAAGWQGFANAWIASHAARLKGQAPKETRKSCEGDVNGDAHSDVVVIYTIEGVGGGNEWTQYAAVLTSAPQGYGATMPKEVGSKGVRSVEGCTVSGTTVELALETWGPKDAACCPSVPGKASLSFAKGALSDPPGTTSSASPAPAPSAK
ncbi:MAG: hypothetical protein ABIR79_13340 [Candidatus Binatia bacterium]